jgi:hypothetical protein
MTVQPPPFTAESFPVTPDLECDVVMKGGITSGVIYPLAVCELAQTFRLRSVGGASAGAIAAAAAAAAEVGRRSVAGSEQRAVVADSAALPVGFLGLSRFPDLLTQGQADGRSLLFHLFRPQPEARRLFDILMAALDGAASLRKAGGKPSVMRVAGAWIAGAVRQLRGGALLGVLPGLLVLLLGLIGLVAAQGAIGVVLSVTLLLLGALIAPIGLATAVLGAVLRDLRRLPAAGFGICSGMGERETDLALTPWLYGRLQELAGRSADQPLTFRDLRAHDINFQLMTTNLSRAEPMVMPWTDDVYFFEPAEFEKLFGKTIVEAMVAHPPPLPSGAAKRRARQVLLLHAGTKRPLPHGSDLPIVVATRMSLSFPLLISAVPLYAVDYTRKGNRDYAAKVADWLATNPAGTVEEHAAAVAGPEFDVNWFSDGGLTANLPVQFFDSPLPTRPTFAIDLAPFGVGRLPDPDERKNSYLPTVNQGGLRRRTARWSPEPLSQLLAFGLSLIQTARTWVDEASLVMPGYRDRVVTVYQDREEGGLNLSMPATVVDRLSLRGRFAAQKLADRFGPTGEGWANHRWLRFRTATAALSDWMKGFERGYSGAGPSYDDMLENVDNQPSYKIKDAARLAVAHARTDSLRAEMRLWSQPPDDVFTNGRPRQPPVLRLVPPTDADPS